MYKNKIVLGVIFLTGIGLVGKFLFNLAERPTDPFILFTLLAVALGFGNIRLSTKSSFNSEFWDRTLRRLFCIELICLCICLVANLLYPATGLLSTILTWVIGHTAVATVKGGFVSSMIVSKVNS